MKVRFVVAVPVLALALSGGFACSSNNKSATGTGGADGGGTAGTAGTSGAGGAGGAASPTEQCTNADDQAAYAAEYPGPDGGTRDIQMISEDCGLGCLGKTDINKCTLDCINQATSNAFSRGCATCFVNSFMCSAQNCADPCITEQFPCCGAHPAVPPSLACHACLCKNNCQQDFATCSGIPDTICGNLDGGAGSGGMGGSAGADAGGGGAGGSIGGAGGAMDAGTG